MENRGSERLNVDVVELINGAASARISTLGAEAVEWCVGGRDLLWGRETPHWDRTAPVLFPCVGWCRDGRVTIAGEAYAMHVHGFAPSIRFEVVSHDGVSVLLELADSAATRMHYPFSFRLRVRYTLEVKALRVDLEVANPGAGPLPYACGFHPGFAWPFAGGAQNDYRIVFAANEDAYVPVITRDGLISYSRRETALHERTLPLDHTTFSHEALCFLDAQSRYVTFEGPQAAIQVEANGFRHWALWSRPGAPFVCIEAWTGHGDPEDFNGEFGDKPSMEHLSPGEARRHGIVLRWLAR
ncbi:MAG: aldose 1-epimerase family protein [Beijerinckiaceae bacterium]|nr:aldose 1-epimerase family protein [Beijerinckiaceae bacterium]